MYNLIVSLHSILRWLILLFAIIVIVQAFIGMTKRKPFLKGNKRAPLYLLISADLQLLAGLYLYFIGPWFGMLKTAGGEVMKNAGQRFFTVEHTVAMLLAIILIHVGYSNTKKNIDDDRKYKRLFWFTLVALIIILASIPWPFRAAIARPWVTMPS